MTGAVDHKATTEYPVMQRTGIQFFRRMAKLGIAIFSGIGKRAYFLFSAFAALYKEPKTYLPLIIPQMRSIGVDSLVLTGIVSAFIGSVIALQTRYQLFPGVQLSVVGLIVRQSIVSIAGKLSRPTISTVRLRRLNQTGADVWDLITRSDPVGRRRPPARQLAGA